MHFSKATIMAAAPFLLGSAMAAPSAEKSTASMQARAPRNHFQQVLKDLDNDGVLEWVDAGDGARFTYVGEEYLDLFDETEAQNDGVSKRKTDDLDLGSFEDEDKTPIPATAHCLGESEDGQIVGADTMRKWVGKGCEAAIRAVIGNVLDDRAGWFVATLPGMTKGSDPVKLMMASQRVGLVSNEPISQMVCEKAGNAVFQKNTCASDGKTKGAEVTAGQWKIRYDPDDE